LSDIYVTVGKMIRALRLSFGGKGISQADLGRAVKVTANTVSRWETGVYKPSIADLEVIAKFFGIPISHMFPQAESSSQMTALWSAMEGLDETDIQEVIRYALFRRATAASTYPKRKSLNR
jgi:transcriptional regulator with XRE-family HTH domain